VAGADEAGRGCTSRAAVAAAVCLDMGGWTQAAGGPGRLKKVPPPLREELAAAICATPAAVSVIIVDRPDRPPGLHRSNLHALARALERWSRCPRSR
jgi:ribonuclease HII